MSSMRGLRLIVSLARLFFDDGDCARFYTTVCSANSLSSTFKDTYSAMKEMVNEAIHNAFQY